MTYRMATLTEKHPPGRLAVGLFLLGLVFILARFGEFPVGAGNDDSYYVELARSLAEGRGPVLQLHPLIPPRYSNVFPLGFPLLLSPLALASPTGTVPLQAWSILATLAMVPLLIHLCRALGRRWLGPAVAVLVLWNPWTVAYSNRVMSEATYGLCSQAALLVFLRWHRDPSCRRPLFWVLVGLLSLSALVRTIGLALIAAVGLSLGRERRFRSGGILLASQAVLLAPQIWINLARGGNLVGSGYVSQVFSHQTGLGGRLTLIASNLAGYLQELPGLMLPVFGNPVRSLAEGAGLEATYRIVLAACGVLLGTTILAAGWRSARRAGDPARVPALYLGIYLLALLNFSGHPSGVQLRLLLPVLPLLYFFSLQGVLDLTGALGRTRCDGGRLVLWSLVVVLPLSAAHNLYRWQHPFRSETEASGRGYVDPTVGSDWVRAHTASTDVFMVQEPLPRHVALCRPVVSFGDLDPAALQQRLRRYDVAFVLVGPKVARRPRHLDATGRQMLALLKHSPGLFASAFADTTEQVYIYRVRRTPTSPRPADLQTGQ